MPNHKNQDEYDYCPMVLQAWDKFLKIQQYFDKVLAQGNFSILNSDANLTGIK